MIERMGRAVATETCQRWSQDIGDPHLDVAAARLLSFRERFRGLTPTAKLCRRCAAKSWDSDTHPQIVLRHPDGIGATQIWADAAPTVARSLAGASGSYGITMSRR
jgi:hypothetical protein